MNKKSERDEILKAKAMTSEDARWNEAIAAALACTIKKNFAPPKEIRKLKNGDTVWDSAIESAASAGIGKYFPTPSQIGALRRSKATES